MMTYKLHYSRTMIAVGIIIFLGLSFILYTYATHETMHPAVKIGMWAALLPLMLYPILSMPLSIERNEQGISIKRLCWSSHYSASEYEISEAAPQSLQYAIRVWGSGGYFGYRGYFYTRREGIFKLTQTNGDQTRYFCLRRQGKKRLHYIAYA